MSLAESLSAGLVQLGLSLSDGQQQALLDYIALLQKWNKVYNLTAVREPENMLYQHLLDSLAVLPYIGAGRLLDVGTGAGLLDSPGGATQYERRSCVVDPAALRGRHGRRGP